jgi:hypothetical protein
MPFWVTFAREEAFFVTVASDYPASLGLYLFLSAWTQLYLHDACGDWRVSFLVSNSYWWC